MKKNFLFLPIFQETIYLHCWWKGVVSCVFIMSSTHLDVTHVGTGWWWGGEWQASLCLDCLRSLESSRIKAGDTGVRVLCFPLYLFFRAAITNHRKLGGLTQQQCVFSQFWRPSPKSRCQQGWLPLRLQGGSSLPPPAPGAPGVLGS